jgi:dihydrofolate reductase
MATIIVACDENNLIGDGDKLPWNIPEDMKHFKETTSGHVIIMGKNTWKSIPRKPLPNRVNCILSRNHTHDTINMFDLDIEWFATLKDALTTTSKYYPAKKQFIIGGEKIYKLALNEDVVDEIIMTRVKGKFNGDKFFPELNNKIWVEKSIIKETTDFKVIKYKKELV